MFKWVKNSLTSWAVGVATQAIEGHATKIKRAARGSGQAKITVAIGSDALDEAIDLATEFDAKYVTYEATNKDTDVLRKDLYRLVVAYGQYVRATRGLLDQALVAQRIWDENVALKLTTTREGVIHAELLAETKRKLEAARKELRPLKLAAFGKGKTFKNARNW